MKNEFEMSEESEGNMAQPKSNYIDEQFSSLLDWFIFIVVGTLLVIGLTCLVG